MCSIKLGFTTNEPEWVDQKKEHNRVFPPASNVPLTYPKSIQCADLLKISYTVIQTLRANHKQDTSQPSTPMTPELNLTPPNLHLGHMGKSLHPRVTLHSPPRSVHNPPPALPIDRCEMNLNRRRGRTRRITKDRSEAVNTLIVTLPNIRSHLG